MFKPLLSSVDQPGCHWWLLGDGDLQACLSWWTVGRLPGLKGVGELSWMDVSQRGRDSRTPSFCWKNSHLFGWGYTRHGICLITKCRRMFTSKDASSSSCVLRCIAAMKKRKTSRTLVKQSNNPDARSEREREREQILLDWLWLEVYQVAIRTQRWSSPTHHICLPN